MIIRLVVLCLSGAGAYLLLKGMPEGLPVLLRACLAVLLLVGGLGWWAARKQVDDVSVVRGKRKPGWSDFLAAGMGVLALECGFLWLLSVTPGPLEEAAMVIEAKFYPEAAAAREESEGATRVSGNWLWNDERQRALPRRTNLKPGAKPEVFVRLPKKEDAERLLKGQVYVRAFVLDDFEEGVWSVGKTAGEELLAGDDGWIRFRKGSGAGILHEVFHGKDNGGRDVLIALQGVDAVRLPGLKKAQDGMWFLPPDEAGGSGFEYFASSEPISLADLKGKTIVAGGTPRRSAGRFGRLAETAAGKGTLLEKLLNIQSFLRERYGYSLVTENPKNLEPLENFLFEEKRGHCEFFATAAALMVRELGVESRVAYGWAGGQYFRESQMFVFRAREAHSWVEVKLDGHGWVSMEPTPPVVLGGGGSPRVAGAGESMPGTDEIESEEYVDVATAGFDHVGRVALALGGAFGVLAAVLFFLRKRTTQNTTGKVSISHKRKTAYFAAWQSVAERRFGNRARAMSLGQQLRALDDEPEFGRELHEYHYGVRYEEKPPDADREGRLEKRISDWKK